MTVALVTDSGSQITPALRRRTGADVVPLTVVLDGTPYLEGVDLPVEKFYRRLEAGASVSTSTAAPGLFLDAYRSAADDGATSVVSVHTGTNLSGTFNAARVAADDSPIPVTLVDTEQASFPVALCVLAAHEARTDGAGAVGVADAARQGALRVGSVFVVGATDLVRAGGRVPIGRDVVSETSVVSLVGAELTPLDQVGTTEEAVEVMAERTLAAVRGGGARVGVGDAVVPDVAEALERRLTGAPEIDELMRYTVGPSVGAHTGAGTVGTVFLTR